jgi:hypothetical protein
MAVKFTLPDGLVIESEDPEAGARAAAKYQRERSVPERAVTPAFGTRRVELTAGGHRSHAGSRSTLPELPQSTRRLVTFLLEQGPDVDVPTHVIVEKLGTNAARLGGDISILTAWGKRYGLTKEDLVINARRRNGGGEPVRTLRLGQKFLDKIMDGTIDSLSVKTTPDW